MKDALNLVAKKNYYDQYTFPGSTPELAVVEMSSSCHGYKTVYKEQWQNIISEKEFDKRITEVSIL